MDKTYSPDSIEQINYENWEKKKIFSPKDEGEPFCIMLPPPNVTGSLHMGHGFQYTIMDALSRYNRMNGKKVLWQPGTDHAGISTQLVVERRLEQEGLSRKSMTRDDFLDHVWKWKEESGNKITQQMRQMGASVDWTKERFTMDEGLSAAVQKVFIQLYEEGLIYRGTRLVNWDPKLGTAVSDLEVISEEEDGYLWHIKYPIVDSDKHITIATTRPETLLGDTAVAVHPDDERYKIFIGKFVQLPLCDRKVPIIADDYVDQNFGSGCVKITPAHDFNDYDIGKRHNLEEMNVMTKKGTISKNAPLKYQGMDRFVARKQVISDLEENHFLLKKEPHKINIPRGEKSNVIIEPLLTEQWYVKIAPLAKPAIDAVKQGDIQFIPGNWSKTYFQWMENIEDWCISRQLWWGHRIPAWYDRQGNIYVGSSEKEVRYKYKLDDKVRLKQDEDVLDTWFSSALWPFSTLGWPEQTQDLKTFYPSSVLVTGFDIIFFWVARMIMMGLKFTGKVPFEKVIITGLIRDSEGKKMSKSKGNVLDPLDIIHGINLEKLIDKRTSSLVLASLKQKIIRDTKKEFPQGIEAYGTDALRFTFCSMASTGKNLRFDLNRVAGDRNFCNKLWNASRYALMNIDEENGDLGDGPFQYSSADQWILSRLQNTISTCRQSIESYRFDLLAHSIYDFVWHEYCDWYLELSKTILKDDQALGSMKRGTRRTLIHVLDQILKLLHPIMPFITEEIWLRIKKFTSQNTDSITISEYPFVHTEYIHPEIESEIEWLKSVIQSIRTIRSEMSISPSKLIPLVLRNVSEVHLQRLDKHNKLLVTMSKVSPVTVIANDEVPPPSATGVVDGLEIFIPMADLIDKDAEQERLKKEIAKLEKDEQAFSAKLANANFTKKAPIEVISKEKERLKITKSTLEKLKQQLATIAQLNNQVGG